jgi:response regulator RpfG family c-di-GMP phosphodiesterase
MPVQHEEDHLNGNRRLKMDARTRATVLVCDPDETARREVCRALASRGLRCIGASSGDEARSLLAATRTEVALIDATVAGRGNPDLLFDALALCPDVRVIVMCPANDSARVAARYLKQGADDCVVKPLDVEEVVNRVQRALETLRPRGEVHDYDQRLEKRASERIFLGVMSALSFALEAKDSYTAGHSRRVADIAVAIGKRLGLGENALECLHWGSLLHDVAMVAVDESVLHKDGKLTPEQYEHVMTHPIVGASLAGALVQKDEILDIIQHHHARYDGGGLKQRLAGESIPVLARIVAVADAYDAMTSERPYRAALSREEALSTIRSESGRQFDPSVAAAFLDMPAEDITPKRDTVLIADDDESTRLLVRSILGNDFAVIEAADGRQAVETSLREKPSLILMDILMPGEDGLEACRHLKANPQTSEIPVVMLSGFDQDANRALSRSAGAARFVAKPFAPQMLLDTVKAFAGGRP